MREGTLNQHFISGRLGAELDGRDEWRRAQVSFRHQHASSDISGRCIDHEFSIGFRVFRVRQAAGPEMNFVHPPDRIAAERRGIEGLLKASIANIQTLPDDLHLTLLEIMNSYSALRRAFVETSAINWLTDHQPEADTFFKLRAEGAFATVVTPEVAWEVRRTSDSQRRRLLEGTLSRFFPLRPTWLPRSGTARASLSIISPDWVWDQDSDLRFLRDAPDRVHIGNAALWSCEAFLTLDGELWRKKSERIRDTVGAMNLLTVQEFLETPEVLGP